MGNQSLDVTLAGVVQPRNATDFFGEPLALRDHRIKAALLREEERQRLQLELIAPKNYVSAAAREAFSSIISFTSGEGYVGQRYHAGMVNLDVIEAAAVDRARQLFNCHYANVQPHSGTQANLAVLFALLEPGDRILSMDLRAGGHLSHGLPANLSGKWFDVANYSVQPSTGLIDQDEVWRLCRDHRPKLIIVGGSSYPRAIDFEWFRHIADETGAFLLADIAHFSGLVATGLYPDAVASAHVVTSTTNKNLRGPRGGLILSNEEALAKRLSSGLFPGTQGGLLPEYVAAKAVCFREALQPEFTDYAAAVLDNARAFCTTLLERGYDVVTGGTDTPLVVVDLRRHGLTGAAASTSLELAGLPSNKNLVPGDRQPPSVTSGLRFGTSAVTTRGLRRPEVEQVAGWVADLLDALATRPEQAPKVEESVRGAVAELAARFPLYPER